MIANRPTLFVSLATASSLLGDQMLYAVLPTHYGHLGLEPYQVGLILSANRIVRLGSNHVAERVCRSQSLVMLLAASLITGALLNIVYGTVTVFLALLGARIVWGVCWSFIRQIGMMTVVDGAAHEHLGRVMGYYSGISRMGSISGNLLGAMGHDLFGFTATLMLFAAASLLAVPLGPLSRRGLPRTRPVDPTSAGRASRGLLWCGFASGCVGQGLLASTLGAVLAARLGHGELGNLFGLGVASLTGVLLASRWIADLLAPLMGALSDAIGRREAGAVYFGAGACVLIAAMPSSSPWVLVAAVLAFYLCATGVAVVLHAEAGSGGARSVAAYVTASDLGSAVGPNLGWLILQMGLAAGTVFALGAGVYAVAGFIAWFALRGAPSGHTPLH